ncbi:hypothetical protein CO112_00865 [Candidatus Dojkabacteria bacterium CG_4_9_14_3_um_filter_150_Dojkabacteria_WS6_41_13]|nr:MAG: hypothetical protein COZ14_02900 [Candidatus Dojkabacteria bacterium CG_4_10_14_3_um_filter_Dojkabacteria_WS6_41_9]PJB23480.1 MAG: hypothetical protein CO112_00865 [Candidatus Dojkabacteria bacterium CG_4_9_14_3_um_filter_150_Dojkabacteria_WS6_41_13]
MYWIFVHFVEKLKSDTRNKTIKYWVILGFFLGITFSFMAARYLNSDKNKIDRTNAQQQVQDLTIANFSSPDISQWNNNAGYLTEVNYSQLKNGAGLFLDYRPNNVACTQNQVLRYEADLNHWICGNTDSGNIPAMGELTATDFVSQNISQWTNNAGYITGLTQSQIANGTGIYSDYRPNNVACTQDQVLKYDAGLNHWVCANDAGGSALAWGGISGTLADQTDLNSALGNKLDLVATFGGDVTGTYDNLAIADDSHAHTGVTISGLGTANFTSTNISQWTNDSGYISGLNFSQVANGTGVYLNYKPNDIACDHNQVLKYDASLTHWVCGDDTGAGVVAWGTLTGTLSDQTDLSTALSSKLNLTASFGGDISGTYDNIAIANDSHAHTGATVSGLGTSNFTSANISQWTNDSGFITGVDVSQVANGAGKYSNYKPNDVACAEGQVLKYDATNARWTCGSDNTGAGGGEAGTQYIHIRDQKAQNTNGGGFTLGAWRTRDLNTILSDETGVVTLSSNQITLPAGTYRVNIIAPAVMVSNHQAILKNITDNTTTLVGTSEYNRTGGTYYAQTLSTIKGSFTIASPKVFEVQHMSSGTNAADGFGHAANVTTEVYTDAEFWKNGSAGVGSVTVGSMTGTSLFADATASNQWLGLGAGAGRVEFDDQTTDEINFLDANIGIGTSTPQHKLDVNGNIGLAASGYLNFGATDSSTGYGFRDNAGIMEYKDSTGTWTALNSLGGGGGASVVASVTTVQTRTQGIYAATGSGDGTPVTPLNIVLTPKKAGNKIILEWMVNGEVNYNTVYNVTRNGVVLPNSNDGANRWSGIATSAYDQDEASTPNNMTIKIVDENSLNVESTYSLLIRSSNAYTVNFSLNRTLASTGGDSYEVMLSTGTATEIDPSATPTSGTVTVGTMTGTSLFADATASNQWLGLGAGAGRIEFDDQTTDEINFLDTNIGIGTSTPQHKLDINGNIGLASSGYLNFGATDGTSGYGIRDDSGIIQAKNSGGTWATVTTESPFAGTLVQQAVNGQSTTALGVTLGSTPTVGNTLIAFIGNTSARTVTLSQTNVTWTKVTNFINGSAALDVWIGTISASAGTTVTITGSGASWLGANVTEWTGLTGTVVQSHITSGTGSVQSTKQFLPTSGNLVVGLSVMTTGATDFASFGGTDLIGGGNWTFPIYVKPIREHTQFMWSAGSGSWVAFIMEIK